MKVATVDGLVTLFYDGSEIVNRLLERELLMKIWKNYENPTEEDLDNHNRYLGSFHRVSDKAKKYWKERQPWQQIIVMEGVTEIPRMTFYNCRNIKRIIFADTVVRIGNYAFKHCSNIVYIKWPINLEHIGIRTFSGCNLSSVYLPPRCREIKDFAFAKNENLAIFHAPEQIELGDHIIHGSKLIEYAPYKSDDDRAWFSQHWAMNVNHSEKNALHRICCSFRPTAESIFAVIENQGIASFPMKNEVGISPCQYLEENPYANITQIEIIRHYVTKMTAN